MDFGMAPSFGWESWDEYHGNFLKNTCATHIKKKSMLGCVETRQNEH